MGKALTAYTDNILRKATGTHKDLREAMLDTLEMS